MGFIFFFLLLLLLPPPPRDTDHLLRRDVGEDDVFTPRAGVVLLEEPGLSVHCAFRVVPALVSVGACSGGKIEIVQQEAAAAAPVIGRRRRRKYLFW